MAPDTINTEKILRALEKDSIRFVRITWVDLINVTHFRIVTLHHFQRLLGYPSSSIAKFGAIPDPPSSSLGDPAKRGGVTITKAAFNMVGIQVAKETPSAGEWLYVPDLSTVRVLPYAPGHVSVMGWLEEKETVTSKEGMEMLKVPLCPRELLRRVVEDARVNYGVSFNIGFETEVIILKSTSPVEGVDEYGWSEAPGSSAGTIGAKVSDEIADALLSAGIDLQMYHKEAAPGQYEFVTGPMAPLQAADALVATREIIYNVATKHGTKATLTPRLHQDNCGSGAHGHISVKSTQPQLYASAHIPSAPGLTHVEASFLQGMLNHLPAASAFTMPTAASYGRAVDGVWSGGTYVTWGRDNREAPVRLCGRTSNYNFEVKCMDGTSNPYLATAALLTAGMLGVKNSTPLTAKNCLVLAASLSEVERSVLGITKRLPLKISEARKYLVEDKEFAHVIGGELVDKYIAINELLEEIMESGSAEESTLRYIQKY